MKIIKKFLITAVAAMPVFLCSCPGDSCVDKHDPKGFVAKMKNDYTDKVLVLMYIDSNGDTSFCCASKKGHTLKVKDDYYILHCHSYDNAVYTSINAGEWDDELLDSLSKYVIDTNPFVELYAYYNNYDMDAIEAIIDNNTLNKLERLK